MSIFKANKKYLSQAREAVNLAENLATQQAEYDLRRSILTNIRQERLAESQIRFAQNIDDISSSSTAGAMSNIQSSFAEPVEYMYTSTDRQNRINKQYEKAQQALDTYQSQAKKAAQVGAVTGLLTGGLGSLAIGAIGGADSNYYKGSIETQVNTLAGAAKGAAAGSVAGGVGAVVGAVVGGLEGATSSVFGQTGKNRQWASATNALRWSKSNYYGHEYRPVTADNWNLNLSGLGYLASGFIGGSQPQQQTTTVVTKGPVGGSINGNVIETWGSVSTFSQTGMLS